MWEYTNLLCFHHEFQKIVYFKYLLEYEKYSLPNLVTPYLTLTFGDF